MRGMTHPAAAPISIRQLCAATGVPAARVEFLVRAGIVVPAREGRGRGTVRGYTVENILEISLAEELAKAGCNSTQLLHAAAVVREAIKDLSPAARMVARFRHYIGTVTRLGELFGFGDGYDAWLKLQTHQLRRMERELARAGDDAGPVLDTRLSDLFVKAASPNGAPSAFAS
jgi:DNA-binding transcriptional MerR regulator